MLLNQVDKVEVLRLSRLRKHGSFSVTEEGASGGSTRSGAGFYWYFRLLPLNGQWKTRQIVVCIWTGYLPWDCITSFTKPPLLQESRLAGGGSPNLMVLVEWKVPIKRIMGAANCFH